MVKGRLSEATWTSWVNSEVPVDPYLVWFDLTYEQSKVDPSPRLVELLIELQGTPQQRSDALLDLFEMGFAAGYPILRGGSHHAGLPAPRFVTGSIRFDSIPRMLRAVRPDVGLIRFELSSPRFVSGAEYQLLRGRLELGAFSRVGKWLGSIARLWGQTPKSRSVGPPETRAPPAVMVVDDFCNLLAPPVARALHTLWHQGMTREAHPEARGVADGASKSPWIFFGGEVKGSVPSDQVSEETYGALLQLRATTVPGRPAAPPPPLNLDYRQLRMVDSALPEWSHGSAVLHQITFAAPETPTQLQGADGALRADVPDELHFVQLPRPAVLDTSGGALTGHALAAIHRALRLTVHRDPAPRAVVVNLSYGTHGGPHDGTSMFEQALLELLDTYDGQGPYPELHVVIPAGNSHLLRHHATDWVEPGATRSLQWKVLPDTETDSLMELWFPAFDDFAVQVVSPDGRVVADGGPGSIKQVPLQADGAVPPASGLSAALIYPRRSARGIRGRQALVAVAPTQRRREQGLGEAFGPGKDEVNPDLALPRIRMEAPSGVWTIRLTNVSSARARFHAWVQRADSAPGGPRRSRGYRGRQSYLLDDTPPDPRFTMNGIATAHHEGRRLWVVGAMDARGTLAAYSAAGPWVSSGVEGLDAAAGGNRVAPDVVVVADNSRNHLGRLAATNHGQGRLRVSGTSLAAAAFTRMLYHALCRVDQMTWSTPVEHGSREVIAAGEPERASSMFRGADVRLDHVSKTGGHEAPRRR